MIVDTSALVAITLGESTRPRLLQALSEAPTRRLAAGTYVESGVVLLRKSSTDAHAQLDRLLEALEIGVEPASIEHARLAIAGYQRYGRGSGHRAGLNLGDCVSYALAVASAEPLLFVGDDFGHTDVQVAHY